MINEIDLKEVPKKKKLYLVLDTETATLPFVSRMNLNEKQQTTIATSMPLIYDLGWQVIDRMGNVYSRHSFLITETFMVPDVFNTAYYRDKRPMYIEKLDNGEIILKSWRDAKRVLLHDMIRVHSSGAYNAGFDTRALKFTDRYIDNLMSANYAKYLDSLEEQARKMLGKKKYKKKDDKPNDRSVFRFSNIDFKVFDLWGMACEHLINTQTYKKHCIEQMAWGASGMFFKTSAEQTFREITKDFAFVESHTALEDAQIESQILIKCLKKKAVTLGIPAMPFMKLGCTGDFLANTNFKFSCEVIYPLHDLLEQKVEDYENSKAWQTRAMNQLEGLNTFAERGKIIHENN